MTKITLKTGENLHKMICYNEKGKGIVLDHKNGVGPMESVLMAVAGCSTIDIVMILEKMRQEVKDIKVDVSGKRSEDHPKVFTELTVHYTLYGKIKEAKAKEAVDLSLEKYCSVSLMIAKSASINHSFEIVEP
jgi:putative redox protein